jgi:hypothetical protein
MTPAWDVTQVGHCVAGAGGVGVVVVVVPVPNKTQI